MPILFVTKQVLHLNINYIHNHIKLTLIEVIYLLSIFILTSFKSCLIFCGNSTTIYSLFKVIYNFE